MQSLEKCEWLFLVGNDRTGPWSRLSVPIALADLQSFDVFGSEARTDLFDLRGVTR